MAERTPRIDVAGLVFRVGGLAAAGRAWVEERYGPFLSRRAPTFGVQVKVSERYRPGRMPRPSAAWHDGRFALASHPSRAEGDLARRRVAFRAGPGPALNPDLFRLLCSFLLMQKGGVLIHASAVVDGSGAWVFSGPSGSGKTTIAGLAGDRVVLNDETIALRPAPRGWQACATPFYGSGGPTMARVNDRAPVRGLCFLRKSSRFAHRRLTPTEVVSRAFPEVMLPKRDARVAERLLATLASLAAAVPAWELAFTPDPAIWSYLDGLD
ncbi:MAG TPA: hypothetical protein VJS92_13080 [Candidatus Polarisedimenticolaceae bacterium]|nr:hypothetical protein [Candidatus Polarisedimenticolaceae bacterium]